MLRILGYPDAAFKNNPDKSSQRGHCIFLAEKRKAKEPTNESVNGSLVDYESTKIKRTTLSTTVAELYSFMKCFGTCQFLRGLWSDISSMISPIYMRTDANNLVTTAGTTHLPEQKETIHMVQMLRKESCSGAIEDLAHIPTKFCLSDPLTKSTINPEVLIKTVVTGKIPLADANPLFRSMLDHKAFSSKENMSNALQCLSNKPLCDYWEQQGSVLIRHHVRPRRCLFNPVFATDLPICCESLLPTRVTKSVDLYGNAQVHNDTWVNTHVQAHAQHAYWTGVTMFIIPAE